MRQLIQVFIFSLCGSTSIGQYTINQNQKMVNIVDNNGAKLFSTLYPNPNRETIILLHGGPGFPSELAEVVQILKDSFQVLTFHQRGTSKSPCTSGIYTMGAYVSDINAIANYYGIEKFHLWGHSWGGLYAQIYTQAYPQKLLSLFLCCPGSGTGQEWKQTEKEVMQLNKSKTNTWQWMCMGINNLLGMMGSDNAYKRLFRQVMKNYNDGFVKSDASAIDFSYLKAEPINKTRPEIVKFPLLKKQENLHIKTTIVYGDKDIYQSSKNFVTERYPLANLKIIPDCGHIPWLHNPVIYKEILHEHYGF
jgi:proline iminopeptidase